MVSISHQRFYGWLAGLAVAFVLLRWPGVVQASESEPTAADETAMRPVAAAATPTATPRIFLPLVAAAPRPSSFALIEQARQRGEIGEETALIYRVFATFGDERLPAPYRGDDSGIIDSDAVSEATLRFAELSPTARETVVPFLIPPVYQGSWYDLRMNGQAATAGAPAAPVNLITDRCKELAQGLFIPLETDHFVIWYPPLDAAFAERALRISIALETRIHPILTEMFREPLSDAGLGCNPGDGRLDIYVPHDPVPGWSAIALVSPYPGKSCKATPTYMLVLKKHWSEVSVLAHEFMHMIQYAYNPTAQCYGDWWWEATANWAVDYFENVDPQADDQLEHRYARGYLAAADKPLVLADGKHEYGAYLWPFYLSHYTGSYRPELIAEIFATTEISGTGNLYQVINDRIAGGWEMRWPDFAMHNLNLAPKNFYEQWDRFPYRWGSWSNTVYTSTLSQGEDPYFVRWLTFSSFQIGDLGIFYKGIKVGDDVRLLAIANPFVGVPFMRLQAMIQRPGQDWQGPEDWSARKWTVLCQDDPAEKVEQIILMVSNSNWQRLTAYEEAPSPMRVVVSDLSCAGWQGASNWQLEGESAGPDVVVNYTLRGEAAPTFALSKRTLVGDVLQLEYQPTSGTASWTTTVTARNLQSGQTATCTRGGGGALTPALGTLVITEDLSGDEMKRRFFGSGLVPAPDRCPGLDAWTHVPWLNTDIRDTGLRPWPPSPANKLRGSDGLSVSGEGHSSTTTSAWDFRTVR